MIVIYTRAFNAEKTIRRTIESVLNQTYTDFRYLLFNNGSTDSTLPIIKEYARQDKRIIVFSVKLNGIGFGSLVGILDYIINNFEDDDYLGNIDADDAYKPDFFEKMMRFIEDNQLDAACCGYNELERGTNKLIACKKLEKNLIMNNEDLPYHFMEYRRYITDMWSKLFKLSLLKYYFENKRADAASILKWNHTQQNFIFDAFLHSMRVGIMAEALMDYYVSGTINKVARIQNNLQLNQIWDIYMIMDKFLSQFVVPEEVRLKNKCYIHAIYMGYLKDIIEMIKYNDVISFSNKINMCIEIFKHSITKNAFALAADKEFHSLRRKAKDELCKGVISYITEQPGWEKYKLNVERIVSEMRNAGVSVHVEPIIKKGKPLALPKDRKFEKSENVEKPIICEPRKVRQIRDSRRRKK